jgi:hypothetical protein
VFLFSAYLLINDNFAFIYLAGGVCASVAICLVKGKLVKNLALVAATLFFGLSLAEVFLAAVLPEGDVATSLSKPKNYKKGYSEQFRLNGGPLGYGPAPGKSVRAWKTVGHDVVYEVTYTIDDSGFRLTPRPATPVGLERTIAFLGGSYAFGEGLNDDETLPFYFARTQDFRHSVLNLGFSGYGPHQMLRILELGLLDDSITGSLDAAIFVVKANHVYRAAGQSWWDPFGPKYELNTNGEPSYVGRFSNVPESLKPIYYRLLQVVEVSRRSRIFDETIGRLVGTTRVDMAPHLPLFAGIVRKAADIVENDYGARFYVLFWDEDPESAQTVITSLVAKEIDIILVSDAIADQNAQRYRLPKDGHPSAAANERLAEHLSQVIVAGE